MLARWTGDNETMRSRDTAVSRLIVSRDRIMENKNQEDLDLLLSLDEEERVLETPPGSPSAPPVYLTDEEESPNVVEADLSDFRSVVQDCIDYNPKPLTNKPKCDIEKFSGLRLRNQLLSPAQISDLFSDIRFVRLPTIKNLLMGDKLSGCWATMGVLTEKGHPRTSSIGQPYCIWKISLSPCSCLKNETEKAASVFGLFNSSLRKDKMVSIIIAHLPVMSLTKMIIHHSPPPPPLPLTDGFILFVAGKLSTPLNQMVKLGVSADYGVCTAKRKDGTTCTSVVKKTSQQAISARC
ncbi:LOW QUALITY PROTEIN: hypothetical protein HID58_095099 [Brassica napus]|uniref:MCM10 OB-fold domain-containing protein n=1 Tax=Brassica napus TaxID=3708 RepID=A0ABQ7X747_BRANA|nr:LOW QUALITY PROTEIN: hypothetical protein HID58_095099 [Brassica napus]